MALFSTTLMIILYSAHLNYLICLIGRIGYQLLRLIFRYSVSNADSQSSSWVWPTKRSFTASIIRLTNTTVVASFKLTF